MKTRATDGAETEPAPENEQENDPTAARLSKMTEDGTGIIVEINKRVVTLEKTGENDVARYILTWGLEGAQHSAGRTGFIAIFDTRLAVEQILDHQPPADKSKKGQLETLGILDGSEKAEHLKHVIRVLIYEILRLQELRLVGYYHCKS